MLYFHRSFAPVGGHGPIKTFLSYKPGSGARPLLLPANWAELVGSILLRPRIVFVFELAVP